METIWIVGGVALALFLWALGYSVVLHLGYDPQWLNWSYEGAWWAALFAPLSLWPVLGRVLFIVIRDGRHPFTREARYRRKLEKIEYRKRMIAAQKELRSLSNPSLSLRLNPFARGA